MNETVVDPEEVMPVIEVVIFMNLSQPMWLQNTKSVHRYCVHSRSLHTVTISIDNLLSRYEKEGLNCWKKR